MGKRGKATTEDAMVLDVISSAITQRKKKHYRTFENKTMFALAKLWSTKDEKKRAEMDVTALQHASSHSSEELQAAIQTIETAGDEIVVDPAEPYHFHQPLLDDCAVDSFPSGAWQNMLRHILFLCPCDLVKVEKKLKEAGTADDDPLVLTFFPGDFPGWFKEAGTKVQACSCRDGHLRRRLVQSLATIKYADICQERKTNVANMNKHLSCLALYHCLSQMASSVPNQWPRFDAIQGFFEERLLDLNTMERFCQVMDVEVRTTRRATKVEGEDELQLEYSLAEDFSVPDGGQDEEQFWQWLNKVFAEMERKGIECTEDDHEQILAWMNRIGSSDKGKEARMTLEDWRLN